MWKARAVVSENVVSVCSHSIAAGCIGAKHARMAGPFTLQARQLAFVWARAPACLNENGRDAAWSVNGDCVRECVSECACECCVPGRNGDFDFIWNVWMIVFCVVLFCVVLFIHSKTIFIVGSADMLPGIWANANIIACCCPRWATDISSELT